MREVILDSIDVAAFIVKYRYRRAPHRSSSGNMRGIR